MVKHDRQCEAGDPEYMTSACRCQERADPLSKARKLNEDIPSGAMRGLPADLQMKVLSDQATIMQAQAALSAAEDLRKIREMMEASICDHGLLICYSCMNQPRGGVYNV